MKLPTGVKRLDDLLKGGIPPATNTLLYGPPFMGKDVLARHFLLAGLRAGEPAILVATNDAAAHVRKRLLDTDPAFENYEAAGLVRFVDAYSRSLGAPDDAPHTEYVDGSMNFNALSLAVSNAQKAVALGHERHRFVFDSISTLIAYSNAQTAFRFLQVLAGKTRMAGAAGLLLLDQGMHTEAEVQMFKHLVNGFFEVRSEGSRYEMRVEGLGVTDNPGWVEYHFNERDFDVVGSFSAGRIR